MQTFMPFKAEFGSEAELREYAENTAFFTQYGGHALSIAGKPAFYYPTEMGGVIVYNDNTISYNRWYRIATKDLGEDFDQVLLTVHSQRVGMLTLLSLLDIATNRCIERQSIEEQKRKYCEFVTRTITD